jgi:1,2-diacylglycerol 3-alpha-glucosyltransferase
LLIIANTLSFNGGSTFIVRVAKELKKRGKKIGVLLLINKIDPNLEKELKDLAEIYYLWNFFKFKSTNSFNKTQLNIFAPINFKKLIKVINKYENSLHIMGVFGLLFTNRLVKYTNKIKLTVGIYQQYEFMYKESSYLTKYTQRLFKNIDCSSVIFFNEANKASYSGFFKVNYERSPIMPIGISISYSNKIYGKFSSRKIVSVGNLYNFKTYNLHIVNLMPELLKIDKNFTYEIYGEGELKNEINKLINDLSLQDNVFLKGRIEYSKFSKVLEDTFLFVGSGTAILEAAVLGVPSIVGIESSKVPETFGFLSDIKGFSYNEYNIFSKIFLIKDRIIEILQEQNWEKASIDCKNKAKEFSIENTVGILCDVNKNNKHSTINSMNNLNYFKLLFSFLFILFKHIFNIDRSFANRRNLST